MKKLWNEMPPACGTAPPVECPDSELLALVRQRQPAAIEQLMRRYNRLLFRAARSILTDDAQAENAVQEAYLRAFSALHSFRGDCSLATWLVRIVIDQALQQQRERAVHEPGGEEPARSEETRMGN